MAKPTQTTSLYLISLAHLSIELCANFLPVVYPLLVMSMDLTYAQIGVNALVSGTGMTLFQPLFGLILVTLIVMSRSWFQMSLVTYLAGWMQSQGWSLTTAGQILSMHLLSISIDSLRGSLLSDKIGRWQVVLLSFVFSGPAYWAFLSTTASAQIAFVPKWLFE